MTVSPEVPRIGFAEVGRSLWSSHIFLVVEIVPGLWVGLPVSVAGRF